MADVDYFVSFDPQGRAAVSRCAPGHCLASSQCGRDRVAGRPLCNECLPELVDWQGSCMRCSEANRGLIALYVVICFIFVLILHALSARGSRSGHIKIFM